MSNDYVPSPTDWVRTQVEAIEASGTTEAASIQGRQVVLLTMTGARTGATRKVPLMRVEHDGVYAAVGSRGGAPTDPQWVRNLDAEPHLTLLDGTLSSDRVARRISGDEYATWWSRAVLSPLNEKSSFARAVIARGIATALGSPLAAS